MRLLVAIMQSRNKCSLLKYDKKRLGCDNPVLFIITQAGQIKYTYLNKVAKLNATKYTVNQPNTNISMQRESAMFLIFRLKSFDNTGLCGSEFQTHPFVPLF